MDVPEAKEEMQAHLLCILPPANAKGKLVVVKVVTKVGKKAEVKAGVKEEAVLVVAKAGMVRAVDVEEETKEEVMEAEASVAVKVEEMVVGMWAVEVNEVAGKVVVVKEVVVKTVE